MLGRAFRLQIGIFGRETRQAIGWTQKELGRRAGLSQPEISKVERARIDQLTFEVAGRILEALGSRARLNLHAPLTADRRLQRDAGHARCIAYVARRLERLGWLVRTEVEVISGSARGWIDLLAFRPSDGTLLVIEIKTQIDDIGLVQRQLAWYVASAWKIARHLGWHSKRALPVLLVLATRRNIDRMSANRELLKREFALPTLELAAIARAPRPAEAYRETSNGRALAMIDPYERSAKWLLPSPTSGRPAAARYEDYAALMRRVRAA